MRIGVYVCHCGGNISEVVDIKEVVSFAGKLPDVVVARDNEHMCSEIGQQMVINNISEHKLDGVVIAACSPQFHEETFRQVVSKAGLNPYMFEMANIREHCSWVHASEPKIATEKAKELVAMAVAKLKLNEPLVKKSISLGNRVLIIGGGIAGIQAALDLADSGFHVYLVEKEPSIGGHMAQLSRTFPTEDCSACILAPKMADVAAHPNITLYAYSEVKNVRGYLGNYEVTIVKKPRYVNMDKCIACGICAEKCPVKVIDVNDFEAGLIPRKAIYIPHEFAVPHKYVIDEKNCLYFTKGVCRVCEKFCPHKAIEFDQKSVEETLKVDTIIVATGYEIFDARKKEMYGYGRFENVLTALQMERIIVNIVKGNPPRDIGKRIAFIQCVGSRDEQIDRLNCSRVCCMYAIKLSQLLKRMNPERDVYVFYIDIRAYGKGFEEYYLRAQETGVRFIRGRVAEIYEKPDKKLVLRVEDTLTGDPYEMEFDTVELSVGMVPGEGTNKVAELLKIPKSPDGFLQEAHPKFRPVDTLTDGIFICGCAQGPKDIPDTVAQASAAAARAIRLMNKKKYEIEPTKAMVIENLCDGCGICVEHCAAGAIEISGGVAKVIEALCRGCGRCVAYCPREAIVVRHYTPSQILAEIEAALSNKQKGESRVLVFADYTCTYRLADSVGTSRMPYTASARIIRVPSGALVTPQLMLKAFELGADAILIGECEQKSSPFLNSVECISDNVERVRKVLKEKGIEPERVKYAEFVTVMLSRFVKEVNSLSELTSRLGEIPAEKRKALSTAKA